MDRDDLPIANHHDLKILIDGSLDPQTTNAINHQLTVSMMTKILYDQITSLIKTNSRIIMRPPDRISYVVRDL